MVLESKDEADARKARAEADRAVAEAREYTSASAAALREAERRGAVLKAETDAVGSAAGRWSSLVPDLTGVQPGGTTATGDTAMYASLLVAKALRRAAEQLAADMGAAALGTVLVTTDADLVAADAAHQQVSAALTELDAAADQLLPREGTEAFGLPLLGLAATALPSVLAMFSTSSAIATSAASPSAASVATVVAGVLAAQQGMTVLHDTFRVPQPGPLDARVAALLARCEGLRAMAATPQPDTGADPRVAMAADLVKRIEAFLAAITAVPAGATRSILTTARARQCLHADQPIHVLLVQEASATTSQLVDTKLGDDPFEVVTSAAVPWVLVRSDREAVVAAGTATGTAKARGKVHGEVTFA